MGILSKVKTLATGKKSDSPKGEVDKASKLDATQDHHLSSTSTEGSSLFDQQDEPSNMEADDELTVGQEVIFFNGRQPKRGVIKEKVDDENYLVTTRTSFGESEVMRPATELKPASAIKGKKARIRFS